jgi:hypothetical protein
MKRLYADIRRKDEERKKRVRSTEGVRQKERRKWRPSLPFHPLTFMTPPPPTPPLGRPFSPLNYRHSNNGRAKDGCLIREQQRVCRVHHECGSGPGPLLPRRLQNSRRHGQRVCVRQEGQHRDEREYLHYPLKSKLVKRRK